MQTTELKARNCCCVAKIQTLDNRGGHNKSCFVAKMANSIRRSSGEGGGGGGGLKNILGVYGDFQPIIENRKNGSNRSDGAGYLPNNSAVIEGVYNKSTDKMGVMQKRRTQ